MSRIREYWYQIRHMRATVCLILINIILFLIVDLSGSSENTMHMIRWGAEYPPLVMEGHQYYRLFTSMFLHFGIEHLLYNMLALGAFGERVEASLGWWKFLLVYLVGGLGGSLLSLVRSLLTQEYAVSAGASGCVFALTGAMLYLVLYHRGRYQNITGRRMLFTILFSLYLGFSSGGVDNAAHLGGLVTGFVMTLLLYHPNRRRSE